MHFVYILAAIIPAILILFYVYKQDEFPEPRPIVIKTFLFGCAITLAVKLLIPAFDDYSQKYFTGETYYFFDSFIRAAFLEEFFKLFILVFYCSRKTEFDEPMDGLVYGVAASLGFAAYENIEYVLYYYKEPSFQMAYMRALSAVPMHALVGVVMGFLITQSIFEKKHNYLNLFMALSIPVLIHGFYNYIYSTSLISNYMATVLLFVLFLRAIYMFRDLKKKQIAGRPKVHAKKYFITGEKLFGISTSLLFVLLVANYLIELTT
jgi:RsiW-degrading membrane proteinase PrsW (M82 family)